MIKNLEVYKKIAGVRNRNKIEKPVYQLITNENFISQVVSEIEIQDPVCNVIIFKKKTSMSLMGLMLGSS